MKNIKKKKDMLSDKDELFCQYYTGKSKFNATAAAKLVYNVKTDSSARATGAKKLANINIIKRIKELTEQRLRDAGFHVDRVTKELIDVAFVDAMDFFETDKDGRLKLKCDLKELPTNAIESIQTKTLQTKYLGRGNKKVEIETWLTTIKFHSKEWALNMLSKLLDMKSGDDGLKDIPIREVIVVREK